MGSFTNGLLIGLGAALLFTPKTGEEMRQLLKERVSALRGNTLQSPEMQQSVAQVGQSMQELQKRTAQATLVTAEAQNTMQEAASSVEAAQRDLDRITRQTGNNPPGTSRS